MSTNGFLSRFSSLRHRDFRMYWFGYVISVSGQQMLWVVEGWLIYELSGSKLLLGAHGLAQAIPATALSLFGGVVADKVDQRRLLIFVQLGQMVLLAVLASLALTEVVQVWHIIGVGMLLAAVGAFENPARQAMFPHLVDREAMPNAVGMNAVVHPGTRIIAPPLAGFMVGGLMAATGRPEIAAGAIFLITSVGFAGYVLLLLQVRMPEVKRSGRGRVLDDLNAGIGFIWHNRIFAVLIGMAYYNMFFGLSLSVLFPVFAKDHLDVGAPGIGLMYTAMGVGSLLGATASASLGASRYQRWLLVGGSGMLGAFTIAFALSTWYPLSLLLLFVLGTGGSVFNVAVQANLQMLVANEFRGRVMGVWSMVHTSVRPLGEMQLGAVAALASAPFALALSGTMVIVFALAVALPNRTVRGLGALRDAARADASRR